MACFLFPVLRDMHFWENPIESEEFKRRGESLTRSMCRELWYDTQDSEQRWVESNPYQEVEDNNRTSNQTTGELSMKRRKFSLKDQIMQVSGNENLSYEVGRYKSTELFQS